MDGGATALDTGGRTIEDLERLGGWWDTSGIALWSVILFGAFILNSTLLLAFIKRPGLRTISNRFVMNLTVSNLLTCCIINLLLMLDAPITLSNPCICAIAEGATALVTASSVFSVLLIAIDQYLAVVDPLRYRTRIDTLKCGILVTLVWLVSLTFSLMAALNPNPKSLWLICQPDELNLSNISTTNSSLYVVEVTKTKIDQLTELSVGEPENLMTYGLIYTTIFSLFSYLLPFMGVCWIYISIYSAAHKNSERTRRTGSRPILSSGSFTDEYYPVRQNLSNEDFRKITKISSLSSIDESTERDLPSQLPRHFSAYANQSSPIQEESSTVIFTVGKQKVDVTPRKPLNDETKETIIERIPISILKAEFLDKKDCKKTDGLVKSKFQDGPEQQRKSSHDLLYEETMKRDLDIFRLRHYSTQSNSDDDDNDNDDDDDDDDDEEEEEEEEEDEDDEDEDEEEKKKENRDIERVNMENLKPTCQNIEKNHLGVDSYDTENIQSISQNHNDIGPRQTCDTRKFAKNKTHSDNVKNIKLKNDIQEEEVYGKFSVGNLESNGFFVNTTPIVTITPPHRTSLHRVSSTKSTNSYINSLKYRISNGSLFKYREETRAARVSAFVIVMSLICWTPYFVVLMLRNVSLDFSKHLPHEIDVIALSFLISTTYVSPLLFGYRSRRVKRELRKLFCFKRELSYKNNRSLMAKKVLKRRHSSTNCEMDNRCNIFHCGYGKHKWPKEKVQFVHVPETALIVETCRSSFSSGASTQVSSTSTDEC